ncbi:MAG: glycosyltransferase WbuB, partial [Pseudomonadota bacterium]
GDAAALARTIDALLTRRGDWDRVKRQARRFVESERTWAKSVARYADVYAAVVARHSGALATARG